jgi:hypothetical protein
MSAADFEIGQGDTDVPWTEPIFDEGGNPVDLTGVGTTVALHYRIDDESAPAVDVTGAVVGSVAPAAAQYLFQSSDTAVPGTYNANWRITLPSGERLTFPPDRHMTFTVLPAS